MANKQLTEAQLTALVKQATDAFGKSITKLPIAALVEEEDYLADLRLELHERLDITIDAFLALIKRMRENIPGLGK